jgi:hypothetical protein
VGTVAELPVCPVSRPSAPDYLIDAAACDASICRSPAGDQLVVQNGLIRRVWQVTPNGACVAFDNLMTGQSMLRSVRPEARLTVDGNTYDVGGLVGQPNHAYLTDEWIARMQSDPAAMQLVDVELGVPRERFAWGQVRRAAPDARWPPQGVYVRMDYALPARGDQHGSNPTGAPGTVPNADRDDQAHAPPADIRVSVHYELYDGLPAMSKWITVHNPSDHAIMLDRFTAEELAVVEHANWVEHRDGVPIPQPEYLHVETDFAFGGFNPQNANRHVVHWRTDPLYTTQVNYALQTPCLLVVEPTYGPAQRIDAGATFESCRVFELAYDDGNRERRGLALRRFYRTLAPWVTENPITHHLLSKDPDRVRAAIDQAAEVGFEMIILSFGSGFNMEDRTPQHLATWKAVAQYGKDRGVELGAYSLFSSRNVGTEHMIVSPEGERPTHGQCPAVTSSWGQQWLSTVLDFFPSSGFALFENDGPYPGDVDVTPRPPLQQGIRDSRWVQWRHTASLYRDLCGRGVSINAPDYYYFNGSNKCGMGYREVNWSLPRAQQVIHTRQNIYDGTWTKTPSMGWMFVPLSQYHGGGAAATIEPLAEHLDHYRMMLQSNLGMGVQAHYRGPRLFDTAETREMVKRQVDWFKRYRDILESDIVHGRRADGRDLDWVLHVNPHLPIKGLLCIYNPLPTEVSSTLAPDLYYTGLTGTAHVSHEGAAEVAMALDDHHRVRLVATVPANAMTWYVFR